MNEWKKVKIGEIFKIEKGSLQSSKCIPGKYDFITAASEWKTHESYSHDCEAIVYADAAAKDSLKILSTLSWNEAIPEWNDEGTSLNEEMVLITQSVKEVNQIMNSYVGIVRSNLRLKRAYDRLEIIFHETENLFQRSVVSKEICELRNIIYTAFLVITSAMKRKESRGLHYTIDYPKKNNHLNCYDIDGLLKSVGKNC